MHHRCHPVPLKPPEDLRNAFFAADRRVKWPPVCWPDAGDVSFGADEKIRGCNHALFFRGNPDGLSEVPLAILNAAAVFVLVPAASIFVWKFIGHDSVAGRTHAGGDRKMTGKGQCWKSRLQGFRFEAIPGDTVDCWCVLKIREIPTKAIDRYKQQVGLVQLLRGIDAAGTRAAGLAAKAQGRGNEGQRHGQEEARYHVLRCICLSSRTTLNSLIPVLILRDIQTWFIQFAVN